jgi:hypothetical protein
MQDEKGNRLDPANAKITARRKDLDGGGRPEVLKLVNGRAALGPGRWEMSVASAVAHASAGAPADAGETAARPPAGHRRKLTVGRAIMPAAAFSGG